MPEQAPDPAVVIKSERTCFTCKGMGMLIQGWPRDTKKPWRWIICVPCSGRGEFRNPTQKWTARPLSRWHKAVSYEMLQFISVEVRKRAPAPTHVTQNKKELTAIHEMRKQQLAKAREVLEQRRHARKPQPNG
jgi:hypothetical protein